MFNKWVKQSSEKVQARARWKTDRPYLSWNLNNKAEIEIPMIEVLVTDHVG